MACVAQMAASNKARTESTRLQDEYLNCMGPAERGSAQLGIARPALDKANQDANAIFYMQNFVLAQLKKEVSNERTMNVLAESVRHESERIEAEIDKLKTEIRTEKRRFLDASPSSTTAVNGLYFTMQPDNQLLIAFLSCLGAFLLFMSLLLIFNYIPIYYLEALSSSQRFQIVGMVWALTAVVTYVGFFVFT
jgi:hypothetical protein